MRAVRRPGLAPATQLTFRLPRPLALRLRLVGPLPSCAVTQTTRLRVRRGVNHVLFAGRVHGRRLQPGVYLLTVVDELGRPLGDRATRVRVLHRGARPLSTVPLATGPCARSEAAQFVPPWLAAAATTLATAPPRSAAVPASAQTPRTAAILPPAGERTLGGRATRIFRKALHPDEGFGVSNALALAVLLAGALSLALLAVLVLRFVRGQWNP